ncbi:hypothetical protein AB0958_07405 [Streptomyces sp. NPDC006655]|uniref:hypothetical protein n=1 Tax=Streptomyces sp. NPDC006655 TaxID=3156898 RepID=UPI0034568270
MNDTAAQGPTRIGPSTRVLLHDLGVRRDGDEWIVGRTVTRTFVALPDRYRRTVRSRRHPAGADPTVRLPAHERRAVRLYSVVLVTGTVACVAFMAAVTLPADVTLLVRAARGLGPGHGLARTADSAAVLLTLGGVNVLWLMTRWRQRRARGPAAKG